MTTKLKITEIIRLFNGLTGLDGLQKSPATEGQSAIFVPFKFTGKFTLLKVKLINILRQPIEEYNKAVESLREQYKAEPGEAPAATLAKAKTFATEIKKLDADEHEIDGLRKFKLADLNLYDADENPKGNVIASTIIEQVVPLIDEDVSPEEKPAASAD